MKYERPVCYKAEKNNPYPLCIGKSENNIIEDKCKGCCLYTEYEMYHNPYGQFER